MIPTFVCFFCCLVVAAFVLRLVVVAVIRLARKNAGEPPYFPKVFSAVAGLAFLVASAQIGTAVFEMRAIYKIGEIARIGESKKRVEEFVTPSFREIVSPEKRAAASESEKDIAETWWVERHHSWFSPILGDSTWMVQFNDEGRVCRSFLSALD